MVQCSATDNCDPNPATSAVIVVTNHDVPQQNGPCVLRIDRYPVNCGDTIDIHLVAPPCPAKGPTSPHAPASPQSPASGFPVYTGEKVVLEVTATDRCGNTATDTYDPAQEPEPGCTDPLPDGTCCPAISEPTPPECKVPLCGPNFH